jgi:hypothetical protein
MTQIINIPESDLVAMCARVSTVCGYAILSKDKQVSIFDYLRRYFPHTDTQTIETAFEWLALGRLQEKLDQHKSLTGLSISRVLDDYNRQFLNKPEKGSKEDRDRSEASDETVRLIQEYSGRRVRYNDEVNDFERKYLLEFWAKEQEKAYRETGHAQILTAQTFDFLASNGSIREWNGEFQYKASDNEYYPLVSYDKANVDAILMRREVEAAKSRLKNYIPSILNDEDYLKKIVVKHYFDLTTPPPGEK